MPEYLFDTEPGYSGDMFAASRGAILATVMDRAGTPLNLLEIGVWEGRGACWLLDNLLTHPDSRYTGVDNWTAPPGIPAVASRNLAFHRGKARILTGDSRLVVPELEGLFDVVVIDGLHTYSGCYADMANCWTKIRSGGMLVVDDYGYPGLDGVAAAVDEWRGQMRMDFTYRDSTVTAVAFKKPEQ